MAKLKTNTRTTIDLHDWNTFVQETYGRPYDFQQQDGCKDRGTEYFTVDEVFEPVEEDTYDNDTIPEDVDTQEMGVSFKGWLARDPKQPLIKQEYDFELDSWWTRNFYPSLDMVVNDLHSKGLLKPGQYMIVIDW